MAVNPTAHSLACLRIGVFVTADAARLATGVGGSPFTGRVSHPLDGEQSFMTSPHRHSPLTSLAWSHCAPTPRNATAVLNDVILRGRVGGFPLIATAGFEYYVGVIARLFGSACVYGQVLKTRRNDRVVRVERCRRIGTAGRLKATLCESEDSETLNTSFVERLNLTIRQGSAYLRRRSPCHARGADQLHGHVDLLRCYDNFIRPHRALKFGRETRTPAMQAGLVNAPMNWSDIFTAPAALYAFHVAVVRVPVAVQLMHTSPAALSSFSWPHEHRSAA